MEPTQTPKQHNLEAFILALITTIGFFGCLYYLFLAELPEKNKELVITLTGSLGTVWILQMGYFFSSSASSKAKDQTIANIVTK